jgi:hypothetical protein
MSSPAISLRSRGRVGASAGSDVRMLRGRLRRTGLGDRESEELADGGSEEFADRESEELANRGSEALGGRASEGLSERR